MTGPFGDVGIWISRRADLDERRAAARAALDLGYTTIWLAGGLAPGVFDDLVDLLDVSDPRVLVGTSVLNIWLETPEHCRRRFAEIEELFPGRLYLGLGVSHGPAVERAALGRFRRPLALMRNYIEELTASSDAIPRERLLIGALGPRMLELSRERTLGTLPYLVGTEHVRAARTAVGPDSVVAPELTVALHDDPQAARAAARGHLSTYLGLPNYTNNFARIGFGPEHLAEGGSDALLDAIYAVGSVETVRKRLSELRDSGADHVAIQVVPGLGRSLPESLAVLTPR